jgi:CheY-like chemotaxis protein
MPHRGPVIIIEDDPDDQEIVEDAFKEIGTTHQLVFFNKSFDAFDYLQTTTSQPFLILCDMNLPQQNGVEFKRQIDNDPLLRPKSIPFVFFSTSVKKKDVDTAYNELTIQGFFQKSTNYEDLKHVLHVIMEYWKVCKHPNSIYDL